MLELETCVSRSRCEERNHGVSCAGESAQISVPSPPCFSTYLFRSSRRSSQARKQCNAKCKGSKIEVIVVRPIRTQKVNRIRQPHHCCCHIHYHYSNPRRHFVEASLIMFFERHCRHYCSFTNNNDTRLSLYRKGATQRQIIIMTLLLLFMNNINKLPTVRGGWCRTSTTTTTTRRSSIRRSLHQRYSGRRSTFGDVSAIQQHRNYRLMTRTSSIYPYPYYYSRYRQQSASTTSSRLLSSLKPASTNTTVEIVSSEDSNHTDDEMTIHYEELKWLSNEIRRHDQLYYEEQPILSDEEYDALTKREEELCQTYPNLLKQWEVESGLGKSATRYGGRVGAVASSSSSETIYSESSSSGNLTTERNTETVDTAEESLIDTSTSSSRPRFLTQEKRLHLQPMLSLDNVHDTDQLLEWLQRLRRKLLPGGTTEIKLLTEPKLDGLSLSIRYERDDGKKGADDRTKNSNRYELVWAATRGDGRQGQDVTSSVREMKIPTSISWATLKEVECPDRFEIRGEVVLPNSVFISVAQNLSYSNARNAASGILLRKTDTAAPIKEGKNQSSEPTTQYLLSQLRFYAYDILLPGDTADSTFISPLLFDSASSREQFESWGFSTPDPVRLTTVKFPDDEVEPFSTTEIKPMIQYYESLQKHREGVTADTRKKQKLVWGDYDMDGCVHKLSDFNLRNLMGASNRAPRWAVAHKFPPMAAVTQLRGVELQVGRTGALTPVAILDPVDLGGVKVQRATLHNFGHMRQILGAEQSETIPVGTPVFVRRAGDVIPQVVSRVATQANQQSDSTDGVKKDTASISLSLPSKCPACGSDVVVDIVNNNRTANATENSRDAPIGQVLRCGGSQFGCGPRALSALTHAYSRDALDIKGMSDSRTQQMMDAGFLRIPSDIFRLAKDPAVLEAIAEMDGWGTKSSQNVAIAANRVASEGVTLARFVYSLNIRHAGVHSSSLIADAYGSVGAFLDALELSSKQDSSAISEDELFTALKEDREVTKGIGPVLIKSLVDYSKNIELVEAARDLANSIRVVDHPCQTEYSTPASDKPFVGMSVVFSGSIAGISRKKAQEKAKELGAASTPGTVSSTTDVLVVGAKVGKSKLDKADKLGVRLMEAADFMDLAGMSQSSSTT